MATFAGGLRHMRCQRQLTGLAARWQQPARQIPNRQLGLRALNTESTNDASNGLLDPEALSALEAIKIPYEGIKHARTVPVSPSYFSREPSFNDLHIRLSQLLSKHFHLPTVSQSEAPMMPWTRLEEMRSHSGEPIKAAHFARVMRVAKRLNLIEPSLRPVEVKAALELFTRDINPSLNVPRPIIIDKFGRAVAAGRRKEATARAFVVEGTGEIQVNGKALNDMFGRIHDRESAVWALTATERLDKYNVWALVEGGGTTGQAEALTLAIAKALVAHEPALKSALRKGKSFSALAPCLTTQANFATFSIAGCITRDPRTVERKKHGRVKARKMPTWVKR